ncbi:MAG TPA: hypothetical protein PKK95_07560 [Vicinamibacterales bacterium]|nr:hypothetical protein [Vicinamibacterales bacterium]
MKTRTRLLPALAALALLVAGTGCVTAYGQPRYGGPYGGGYADVGRIAYDNGYRRGIDRGSDDARSGRAANYRNDRDYRDADWGYDHRYGARGQYRQAFRRGYEAGYRDGFAREARGYGNGRYGGRAVPRDGRYGYPDPRYGGYGYASPAYDKGYRDGFEKGRDDGRDGDRYDPIRHKWYREGDRDYKSRYGSREQYKAAYREAFRQGYEEGYREGRYRR